MQFNRNEEIKVSLAGNSGSGKTSFIKKMLYNEQIEEHIHTLGVEVYPDNEGMNFWDTAGDERFGGLRDGYFLNSDVVICFLDASSQNPKQELTILHNYRAIHNQYSR
jgi:GTP-binding nuclear protein Ran